MSAPSFLQSPEWQEIQERMGRSCGRLSGVLVIRHNLPFGFHYLYAPRPQPPGEDFFAAALARRDGALFLKIDPLEPLPAAPFGLTAYSLQPPATILVDCQRDDGELLAAMHPKTRYNIRLAERHGVSVRQSRRPVSATDAETFRALLSSAARRDGFRPHPREHYRILLDVATEQFSNELFIAEHRGRVLAVALVNFYRPSKTATYLHGGSGYEHRALMGPHLLHWRIIQDCREQGMVTYDFGGVDSVRWSGVTRFKQGFGGMRHEYPHPVDYVFRPLAYRLYCLQRMLRH